MEEQLLKINDGFIHFMNTVTTQTIDFSYWVYFYSTEIVSNTIPIMKKKGIELFWNILRLYIWIKTNMIEPFLLFLQFDKHIEKHDPLFEPIDCKEWKSVSSLFKEKRKREIPPRSVLLSIVPIDKMVEFFFIDTFTWFVYTTDDESDESNDSNKKEDSKNNDNFDDESDDSRINEEIKDDESEKTDDSLVDSLETYDHIIKEKDIDISEPNSEISESENEVDTDVDTETDTEYDVSYIDIYKKNGENLLCFKETIYCDIDDYTLLLQKQEDVSQNIEKMVERHLHLFYSELSWNPPCSYKKNRNQITLENNNANAIERLFTFKRNEDYLFRTCYFGYSIKQNEIKTSFSPSSFSFLYIEYRHPLMKTPIEIDLNKHYYMEGNELFTPLFVFRYLQYQSLPFLFDELYSIHLIDENASPIELDYFHYIKIHKNDYEIIDYLANYE
jgi:hypothetical protein